MSPRPKAAAPDAPRAPSRCRRAASARPKAMPDTPWLSPTVRPAREARRRALSRSAFGRPSIFSGRATLSSTVFAESRLKCWKIMPMRRRSGCSSRSPSRAMSRPSMKISPESGRSSPLRQRISVDFPAPLRPIMPRISPLRTLSDTPSRAAVVPNRRLTSVSLTTSTGVRTSATCCTVAEKCWFTMLLSDLPGASLQIRRGGPPSMRAARHSGMPICRAQ